MRKIYRTPIQLVGLALLAQGAVAQTRPAVLELFTSEGCSSCPPAEKYIAELAQRTDVLPLSFHVNYWDDLGWKDRFGLESGTNRQRSYAQSLRSSQVYTPQAIIDGRQNAVGSDRRTIGASIDARREGVPIAIASTADQIQVKVGGRPSMADCDVVLIGYLRNAVTPIGRGENSGRTIEEANIVRSIKNLGEWSGEEQSYKADRSAFPKDVTHVAVLLQAKNLGPIIGAEALALK